MSTVVNLVNVLTVLQLAMEFGIVMTDLTKRGIYVEHSSKLIHYEYVNWL